jgi:hypothetical protein
MNVRCVVVDAMHLDGRLWTHDIELKVRLRTSGFDRFYEP